MRENPPWVSVGLVVRNGEATITAAIRSVLAQTYPHFELLVADDGSRDHTVERILQVKDPRMRLLSHPDSKGLAFRLNELVEVSQAKYFARMDGDDIALPERLGKQVQFLEDHPEVDLLGSNTINFEGDGRIVGKSRVVPSHEEICQKPWRGFPLYHPTWMGRLGWFRSHRYDPALLRAQDFELLFRTFRSSRFHCLPEALLGYRVEQLTVRRQYRSRASVCRVLLRHALRERDMASLAGGLEQLLKGVLDTLAILSGLRFRLLRHRALPVSDAERAMFIRAWQDLHTR